jgi:hypothetical protein
MRRNCLDVGAPIDSVLVHCSKPVFSEFGASVAVPHYGSFLTRGYSFPRRSRTNEKHPQMDRSAGAVIPAVPHEDCSHLSKHYWGELNLEHHP